MSKLVYSMGVSLDGYIAGPDGEIAMLTPTEELHRFHNEQAQGLAAHLCGRRLYEVMSYWDTAAEEDPSLPEHELEFAAIWKALPKVVFSTTLDRVGKNARLATGDLATEVAALKEESDGEIAVGGAGLAAECMRLGLIDELRPVVDPVLAGGGTPFFPQLDDRVDLRLVETRTFSTGTVYLRYEAA